MKKLILKKGLIPYKFIRRYINILIFILLLLTFIFLTNFIKNSLKINKTDSLNLFIIFLSLSIAIISFQVILFFYNKKKPIYFKKINHIELFKYINKLWKKDNLKINSINNKHDDNYLYNLKINNENSYDINYKNQSYIIGNFYTDIFNQNQHHVNFLNIQSNFNKRFTYIKFENKTNIKSNKIIFNINKLKNNLDFSNIYFVNKEISKEFKKNIIKNIIETKSYPNFIIEEKFIYLFFETSIIFKNDDNSGKLFNIIDYKNLKDVNEMLLKNLKDINLLINWAEKINSN